MNQCSYCKSKQLYQLKNGYVKCAKCKRKLSLKKHQRLLDLIYAFCQNKNALQTSKELKLNYITVSDYFKKFRTLLTLYLDKQNQMQSQTSKEYDEYIYIKNDNLYNAQNLLTFVYGKQVYNLMLPSLYKFRTFDKSEEELSKFLFLNKIAKIESKHGIITEFWKFLEDFLRNFKGVDSSNFVYYLKEAEFKFNYTTEQQEETLLELYYKK